MLTSILNYDLKKEGRGVYINPDNYTVITLKDDKLYFPENVWLKVDSVELTIKDHQGNRVGAYNRFGGLTISSDNRDFSIYNGNYIRKDSQQYNQVRKERLEKPEFRKRYKIKEVYDWIYMGTDVQLTFNDFLY